MANKEYYEKYENKLLISIFDKYVSENSRALVALEIYKFNNLDPSLYETIPEITLEKIAGSTLQNTQSNYLGNLEFKCYVKKCGPFHFYLTHSGYEKAKRLKNPIKYFAKKHWKFILGTTFTFIATMVALIQLVKYE